MKRESRTVDRSHQVDSPPVSRHLPLVDREPVRNLELCAGRLRNDVRVISDRFGSVRLRQLARALADDGCAEQRGVVTKNNAYARTITPLACAKWRSVSLTMRPRI